MAAGQRVLCVAAAAALLVVVAGCGERREPKGKLSIYPVTVQGAGDAPTMLRRTPARIVPLTRGLAAILLALGRRDETVGIGRHPIYTLGGERLVQTLERLRPELIVAPPALNPNELRRFVDATGAALYVFPETTLHDVERGLTQLGLLVGSPVGARALVHRIEDQRRLVAERLAGRRRTRVFVDAGYGTTIASRTLLGDLIREAGGTDAAGPAPGPGPLTASELERLDPDVYVALSTSGTTLEKLRGGRLATLRAVRAGRFAVLNAVFLEAGPRLDVGLATLARILHPDAFRTR